MIDVALKATKAYGRDDLDGRLVGMRELVMNPGAHVVVCGEFKQGKSSLVNALVGRAICPVDDDVATAVPTFINWQKKAGAWATPSVPGEDADRGTVMIKLDEVPDRVLERRGTDATTGASVARVRVGLPVALLQDGLVLVDTPGVGGIGSAHSAATLAALPFAEAVLFVSDASQEYTESELTFLRQARDLCRRVVCVVTKTDLCPDWRRIVEADQAHLRRAGIDATILAVSSALQTMGKDDDDPELLAEAGFAELLEVLETTVSASVMDELAARVASELAAVVRLVAIPFEAIVANLSDGAAATAALERATSDAKHLRSEASRWSTTLSDGIADIRSEVSHDLRRRLRDVVAGSDDAIDVGDPARDWETIERDLRAKVAQEIVANYTVLRDRASQVADEVAAHFRDAAGDGFEDLAVFDPIPLLDGLGDGPTPNFSDRSRVSKTLSAARGANSGIFMFRSAAGLILGGLNPLGAPIMVATAGVALVMGRRTMSEERVRELAQARAQARAAVRKYVDHLTFEVGKHSQDTVVDLQRQFRDHYQERSQEVLRSTSAAVDAARRAAEGTKAAQAKQLKRAQAELQRIGQLQADVATLAQSTRAPAQASS